MSGGWGQSPWGSGEWGAGAITALQLLNAVAIRENVIRLSFNAPPKLSGTLDPNDATNPERYNVTEDATTTGNDGLPARPVLPVVVGLADVEFSFGAILDLTVDRPLSPYPAQYTVAVNQLVSGNVLLDPAASSFKLFGVYRELRLQSTDIVASRDIAYKQSIVNDDPVPGSSAFLVGSDGDYKYDEGTENLKKRVIRRLITRPNGFASLPGYGVGIPTFGKRLAIAGIRQRIAAESERQLMLEPDVVAAKVTFRTSSTNPEMTIFDIRVRSVGGTDLNIPLQFSAR